MKMGDVHGLNFTLKNTKNTISLIDTNILITINTIINFNLINSIIIKTFKQHMMVLLCLKLSPRSATNRVQ